MNSLSLWGESQREGESSDWSPPLIPACRQAGQPSPQGEKEFIGYFRFTMALMVPREVLDEILDRADLIGSISEYVPLKKSGKNYKGLCPFHQEKTPSFMVSPDKQVFHCFGCGQGGNLYGFIMKMENLSFPEVIKRLADKAGVDITPYEKGGETVGQNKEVFYRINRYAAWFFADNLKKPIGGYAAKYLQKRGIKESTSETFRLGYAPNEWEGLARFLKEKKVPLESAEQLGLIRKKKGGNYYDFFRNRLMFPIMDYESRVIGFGGRRLIDSGKTLEAKYINSSESPIYHKGMSIYGLSQAKKMLKEKDEVILVEGYLDLIRIFQEGIENVAAPLGTALTVPQVRCLTRFAKNFVIMFDGDEAGRNAFLRSLVLLFGTGHHPKIVPLPQGEDPDTFVTKRGARALTEKIASARMAMEWMMVEILGKGGVRTSSRISAAKKILPYIQELSSNLERKSYMARLAQFLGLGEEALIDLMAKPGKEGEEVVKLSERSKNSLERILLGLYVKAPIKVCGFINKGIFEQFEDEKLKTLALTLWNQHEKTKSISLDKLISADDQFDENFVSQFAFEDESEQEDKGLLRFAEDCFLQWKRHRLKNELLGLTGQIHLAEIQNDSNLLKELLAKKNRAIKNLKELTPMR